MRPERAIQELVALKQEAETTQLMNGDPDLESWKAKVRSVFVASLGRDDHLIERFDNVHYWLSMWSTSTPRSAFDKARHNGIRNACGVIDAAIYQLKLLSEDNEPVDENAFDPELWEHVKNLVEDEDWGKVASQTAIFVENHIRIWAGDPKDKNGDGLYGKVLYAAVLADDSDWRLGSRSGEREGWRMLGTGFAQAVGNVDRHRIQSRTDARRYATGVLDLGSLLLTQPRQEHADLISEITAP
ncbi:MAG: TIGR02391 family protein [Thermomicrobiales bacterium]